MINYPGILLVNNSVSLREQKTALMLSHFPNAISMKKGLILSLKFFIIQYTRKILTGMAPPFNIGFQDHMIFR